MAKTNKPQTFKASLKKFLVPTENLKWECPEEQFNFKTTAEIKPLEKIIGQPRAIEAIRLGSELFAKGYNIFVTGLSGTGRLTTVKRILEDVTTTSPTTYDYCYVNNFHQEDHPRLIKLPKGKGKEFSRAMDDTINYLRRRLPRHFEEEDYQQARRKIIEEYKAKERDILKEFDEKIEPHGFIRGQLENENGNSQPEVFPLIDGKPVQMPEIEELLRDGKITAAKAKRIKELYKKFHEEIYELARIGMKMMKEFRKALEKNDVAQAELIVKPVLEEIPEQFNEKNVAEYIKEVQEYILDNHQIFLPLESTPKSQIELLTSEKDADKFIYFKVNVILDNSKTKKAPVVIETTPSYSNLFGTIEKDYDKRGFWRTDFTKIKAGALLKADQGFLIVNANDLFNESGVWQALKRVLLYDKLEIQPFDSYFQISQSHLKPEPINVNVKVIIIGGQTLYRYLYAYEKGFKKIFKINAQFDYELHRNEEIMQDYARFISKICTEENLPHCTPDGVSAIIEWATKMAGSQNKITLKFSDVADILRESAFYDRGSKRKFINREDVEKAIDWRRKRNDLIDSKIRGHILEDDIFIDTDGERVGQINGLTVYDNGIMSFGKPARITASVSPGNSGITNIEREADMSGKIHNKGVLIITGFLREKFSIKKPLTLNASIAFEQNYGGIDGDSASAAEIYIILSAIAELPISQSFAITGSVNQKGDIQTIGGVNEKITGFYEICKNRGLTGKQGVIIPKQNVKDLMLGYELIKDVKAGKFRIFAISKIDDAVELLMNIKPGNLRKDGNYTANSLYDKVVKRLEKFYSITRPQSSKNKKGNRSK